MFGNPPFIFSSIYSSDRINTSFLQIYQVDMTRTLDEWESFFKQAYKLNIKHFILQWTAYGDVLFYEKNDPHTLLARVIQAAQKEKIKLTIGLRYDPTFWSALSGSDSQLRNYLENRYQQQVQLLPGLVNIINEIDPHSKTVIGWYISDEIDDQNWQSESHRIILKNYLGPLIQLLKKEKNIPISISTYSTGKTPFSQIAGLYQFLFNIPGLDKVLFQDSIGTNNLNLFSLEIYLLTIQLQVKEYREHFGIITELFSIKEDGNSLSAPPARVLKQLELARKFTNTDIGLFAFSPYILPNKPSTHYPELYYFWQQMRHSSQVE